MCKYLLNLLIIFLMLSSVSFAKGYDTKIKEEFGKDLTHAPFTLRFSFSKKYHKEWKESTFAERRAYLTAYEIGVDQDKAQTRAQARADALYRRDRANAARQAARAQRNKQMADAQEVKAEARADADRNKAFNKEVSSQHKDLQQMLKNQSQGN